jgi:DNA repair exonuclease SbcCD ATPase subunit
MPANNRSTTRPGTGSVVARELDQLKKKVKELTLKLEREAKARRLDTRLAVEAKKTRAQLTKEITALREHGRKVASQLKSTLGDASKRKQALKEARAKVAELREELGRKMADLRRKSGELKKLAEEAARRAAAIIRGDAQRASEPVAAETAAPAMSLEPGSESHQNDKPTPT